MNVHAKINIWTHCRSNINWKTLCPLNPVVVLGTDCYLGIIQVIFPLSFELLLTLFLQQLIFNNGEFNVVQSVHCVAVLNPLLLMFWVAVPVLWCKAVLHFATTKFYIVWLLNFQILWLDNVCFPYMLTYLECGRVTPLRQPSLPRSLLLLIILILLFIIK